MKHLKKFETQQDYEAFISVMVKPNISLIKDEEEEVIYNPFINTTGVTLNTDSLSFVGTGSTQNLTATVLPNDATNKNISWASNDESIATVSSGGVVTAVDYGNATITVTTTNGGLTANCNVDIAKNQGQVTTAPTAVTGLVYDATAQELVTAGVGTGTMLYKLDDGEWSDGIPTATNATSYTVYYKASASTDYTESASGSVSCSIAKVTPTVTAPTPKLLTYNGSSQVLANAGSTNFGTIKYNIDGGNWQASVPSRTNGGNYTVGYMIEGDDNVNGVTAQYINCSINEKPVTATVELSQTAYTYNGSAFEPTVTVKDGSTVIDPSEYTFTYSNNTNAGTATVTIYDVTAGNYNVEGSATFTINKAAGSVTTAPTAITGLTQTGSAQALVNAGSGTGTMLYNLDGGAWGTSIPTATNAGTYTVGYKASASTNYNESTTGSVSAEIECTSHNGHCYVEIGGLKWATMNIGASSETDYGLYFQWGDISGYTSSQVGTDKVFDWANYKYGSSSPFSKYDTDGKTVLELSDDAARANWGGAWRMPTTAEFQALGAATTSAWTTDYQGSGVRGLVLTSTADSSKKLFFPSAGYCRNSSVSAVGSSGLYRSSSLRTSNVQYAHILYFVNNNVRWQEYNYRSDGYPVRPVVG